MCCPDGRAKRHNRIDREQVGHGVWQIGVRHSLTVWVSLLQSPKRMRLARQSATAQTAGLRALVGLTLRRACAQHRFVRFAYVGFDSVRNRNADGFLVIYVYVECFFRIANKLLGGGSWLMNAFILRSHMPFLCR